MELISSTPVVAGQMERAQRTTEIRFEADFSYSCTEYVGDRWLLVGDAGSFLDPVFSTGVQLALESGEQAAKAIDSALRNSAVRPAVLNRYQRSQRRRYLHFRRYVRRFYDPAFRDLLCQPSGRLGLLRAVTSVLSGRSTLGWGVRWRMELVFLLARLQRWLPLAKRIHDRPVRRSVDA